MMRIPAAIAAAQRSAIAAWCDQPAWQLTSAAAHVVQQLLRSLDDAAGEFERRGDNVAVHRSASVEPGAVLKGPLIIGPDCLIAAGAYLRGGCWLDRGCVIGPGSELKSSFVFARSHLAHFNFVGDCVIGSDVNFEAGSIVCNTRNERADGVIRVRSGGGFTTIDAAKFGALIGDGCRIGANAVLAPGTLLAPGAIVARLALIDQDSGVDQDCDVDRTAMRDQQRDA